jgi:hypothetical protein
MSLPMESQFSQSLQTAFENGDGELANKQLEQENLSFLQKIIEALLRGDLDLFANYFSDSAEMEIFCPEQFGFIKRAKGRDEIKNAVAYNFSVLEDQQTELITVVAQGNEIILVGQEKGIFRDSKKSYDIYFMQQYTITDDFLRHIRQIISFSE